MYTHLLLNYSESKSADVTCETADSKKKTYHFNLVPYESSHAATAKVYVDPEVVEVQYTAPFLLTMIDMRDKSVDMRLICEMFPNAKHFIGPSRALYTLAWRDRSFPNLVSATMMLGEYTGEAQDQLHSTLESFLNAHSGQIQNMHLRCVKAHLNYAPPDRLLALMDNIPSLTLGSASLQGMPLTRLLSANRRKLSLFLTENEIQRWASGIAEVAATIELRDLSIVTYGGSQYTKFNVEENWEDLGFILSAMQLTLTNLVVQDEAGIFGCVNTGRLVQLLHNTSVTQLCFDSPDTLHINGAYLESHAPNLCLLKTRRPHNGSGSGTWTFKDAFMRREVWGYMCVALAFCRANSSSYIKESYAPLIALIAKAAGWSDAHGSLTYYKLHQQEFVKRLFSLTKGTRKTQTIAPDPASTKSAAASCVLC